LKQDADLILFIYRDEFITPISEDKGTAEIIVGKNNVRSNGRASMTFMWQRLRASKWILLTANFYMEELTMRTIQATRFLKCVTNINTCGL